MTLATDVEAEVKKEGEFRGVLEDAADLIETLASFCGETNPIGELTALLRHGVDNPAQLRLLMKAATAKKR